MSDLIDKQAAIGGLIVGAAIMDGRHNMDFVDGLKFCINRLSAMPSAQSEIIHCGDCRHWKNDHLCECLSRYGTFETEIHFYCGFAERREE